MKKLHLIKQPYAVTTARYKLNINEQRIMLRILEALQPDINTNFNKVSDTLLGDKLVIIPTKNLLPEGHKNYERVKDALISLPKKRISVKCFEKGKGEYIAYTGLILESRYFNRNQYVEIKISKNILPLFLNIKNGYTKFILQVAFNFSSTHSVRIYQKLSHWVNGSAKKERINIFFEGIKKELGISEKYKFSGLFKKKILETASKELKEKADLWFSIESSIKEGRKVIGWEIKLHKKKGGLLPKNPTSLKIRKTPKSLEIKKREDSDIKPVDSKSTLINEKKQKAIKILVNHGISKGLAISLVNKYPLEYIFKCHFMIKEREGTKKHIVNPAGYIINMLKNNKYDIRS